jgi:hypothetical protein
VALERHHPRRNLLKAPGNRAEQPGTGHGRQVTHEPGVVAQAVERGIELRRCRRRTRGRNVAGGIAGFGVLEIRADSGEHGRAGFVAP